MAYTVTPPPPFTPCIHDWQVLLLGPITVLTADGRSCPQPGIDRCDLCGETRIRSAESHLTYGLLPTQLWPTEDR